MKKIIVFVEGKVELDFAALKKFLIRQTKCAVAVKKITYAGKDLDAYAARFARLRIQGLRPQKKNQVLPQEIVFEKNILLGRANPAGAVYEGVKLSALFNALLGIRPDRSLCHIVVTRRCPASFDDDGRYHLRAAIFGYPTLISPTGIIEAPARPRQYYILKHKLLALGKWDNDYPRIKKQFQGRFIDYDDKRINQAIRGYFLQALFYYLIGEPFCRDKRCCLFNAHWQEELIEAQIKSGKLCEKHRTIIKQMRIADFGMRNKRN